LSNHPERCVIAHPFIRASGPLVEIVGGAKTSEETIRRIGILYGAGQETVRLHKEVPGHVANRLQAALPASVLSGRRGRRQRRRVDTAVSWDRVPWGIMGSAAQSPRRRPGGMEHFLQLIHRSMNGLVEGVGSPNDAGAAEEAHRWRSRRSGSRSIDNLARARRGLLGL